MSATVPSLLLLGLAMGAPPPEPVGAARSLETPQLAEGDRAPAFKLRGLDQSLVRLDELAYPGPEKRWAKKRPVLLDFFRTDCGPCRAAMPELVALHHAYQARGLKVVVVALLEPEDGRAKLERYLAEQKLPLTVVVDDTEHFAQQYLGKTVALPATFLIDREGTLRRVKHGNKGSLKETFDSVISGLLSSAEVRP